MLRSSLLSFLYSILICLPTSAQDLTPVGLAKIDITPDYPIRLAGFGFRRTESEGITQRIWAKALVIGQDQPVMLFALDACGISHDFVEKLAKTLEQKFKLPRERLAVTVTHTHTAPLIQGYLTSTLFGLPIPAEHQAHIQQYTTELMAKLEQVAEHAWKQRQPSKLSWGMGTCTFAKNRRPQGGPVDHDMPLLAIHDDKGKLRGVWVNYACHCVTLSHNKIGGDWAGFAAEMIEKDHPGAVALISIGCGADSNPDRGVTGDKVEFAEKQGGFLAAEVKRLLGGFLAPLPGNILVKYNTFTLPLAKPPSETEFQERAKKNDAIGYHARVQLERLAKGEPLPTTVPYAVQTWSFGDVLATVFLPGEVVVDYALRLKKELHGQRLWINAYSNHVPCYIPSERILKEGGYEGGGAMTYYNLPAPFATGLEDVIVSEVKKQLEPTFRPPFDPNKLGGSKPLSPQQSAGAIKVRNDLAVELMVAEPLVTSPVAISFAPDGKLWVAEMYDYPKGLDGKFQPGGRVKLLESSRGDGHYDKATVFLDNIPFPTGVTAWRKGVLVCAAPDILYAEDTKGTGKADVVKKLYSGFGTHNYQARVNSLEYGLDGWVYGSCGLFGGTITSFTGKKLQLGNRDFRIKPDTGDIEPATGQTQQGRVRDDWDNWFGCDNTTIARHYPLPDHYLKRQPALKPPAVGVFLAEGLNANRFFPLRAQIQLFELSGPPGLPTAACGIGVYRDYLLGQDLTSNLFICEPVNLLVHRLKLEPKGSSFIGNRPTDEPSSEFLASTDNWFRPVQMRTGPDGCIWIVDMYRLVIEHPQWIPPADLAKLDVRAGSTMGRIYRIRRAELTRHVRNIALDDGAALARQLNTTNGTTRDLVMMQIVWNKVTSAQQELEDIAQTSNFPEARLQALCTLEMLGQLNEVPVLQGLQDPNDMVKQTALRLAEPWLARSTTVQRAFVRVCLQTAKSSVRLQAALSLRAWPSPQAGALLGKLVAESQDDDYLTAAALSSLRAENRGNFIGVVLDAAEQGRLSGSHFFEQVMPIVLSESDKALLTHLVQRIAKRSDKGYSRWQFMMLGACLPYLHEHYSQFQNQKELQQQLQPVYHAARELVSKTEVNEADRLAGLGVIFGPGQSKQAEDAGRELLRTLLSPQQSPVIQQAALRELSRNMQSDLPGKLCKQWKSYSPAIRSRLVDLFLGKVELQRELLKAIAERQEIPASHLDASSKQRLLTSKDAEVRAMAEKVFSSTSADRLSVIKQYSPLVSTSGDAAKGKLVFGRVCSVCHKLGDQGHAVGPDLAALANRSPSYLLQEILDPNRNLDSRYVEYVAVTKQGRTITGLLASETENSITLKGKEGREEALLRSELEELQATGKSLMPEGLEKEITPIEMTDLLSFLGKAGHGAKTLAGNTPAIVTPDKEVLALRANQAEIFGNEITYETGFQNVGMWHGVNDYVVWTVQVPKRGGYDVYLDWACANDSAGNHFVLESGDGSLKAEVAGTGGWSHYLRVRIGQLKLEAGLQRIKLRPEGPALRGALMDLRTIYLTPPDKFLHLQDEPTSREKPVPPSR